MFRLLIGCIKAFGVAGIFLYIKLKLYHKKIRLPGIKHPLTMRPVMTDRTTFREIFMKREYDFDLPAELNVNTIIDAGANIGFTSIFFANKYKDARIISIEPDEENFKYLSANTKSYPNITPIRAALWNTEERLSVVDESFGKRGIMMGKGTDSGSVDSFSVGTLMRNHGMKSIDILKMDIEGSEKDVFAENYEQWLPYTRCLVIEIHDRMKRGCSKAVLTAISKYNFSLSIKGENLIFIKEDLSIPL